MHVPVLLLLLFVPNPQCFKDVKNKSGTRYNNIGFTSNKETKAICCKEDPEASMPLGPSHLPHFRQKLTLLYFSCQENTPKPFPLVRLHLKMALLATSSKSMQAPQQSTALPSPWTTPAPCSEGLLIHPNYDFSLHLWVTLPKLSTMA